MIGVQDLGNNTGMAEAINNANSNSLIDKLEKAYSEKDKQRLKEACDDFEAILLSSIFKEMKKSIPESGLFEKSIADDIFNDMFVDEVSKKASSQGGVGLSKLLYDSILRRIENAYRFKDEK
ncbi:rod-binding protein [Caldicellulosiruptor morganii]|uniref:Rod-binding protein n=1 Tax=Caldicellulosiruptor morganii TaxID=1387555 RepID=A0ABY7BMK5_9FIRM|nr:rod-binding protein [Caldicellulosiruptor morganii]WAM34083.1 rod-binding protein [Caldicellulosiruptor morganii]